MMDQSLLLRLVALVIIALVYMLFDIFNNRNVPSIFAYATLAVGVAFTISYLNLMTMAISFAIAAIILSLGYVVYKAGQIGAADIIEFAALSMILPVQIPGLLLNTYQYNIPFIVSIFVATGMSALVITPLYYIPRAKRLFKKPLSSMVNRKDIYKGLLYAAGYLAFALFIMYLNGFDVVSFSLIVILMLGSLFTVVYEMPITDSMVRFVTLKDFEEGDIIAFNLMKKDEIARVKKQVRGFDRLITGRVLAEMRRKRFTKRLPVYKNAVPLALPIFIGVVLSLLLGNLVFLII